MDIEEDSSNEVFIPEWSVTRGARLRDAATCREVMVHFVPPAEEKFLNLHDDDEAARRGWYVLGKSASALSDVLLRFESLRGEHDKLLALHKGCERIVKEGLRSAEEARVELERLQATHANCSVEGSEEFKKL